MRPMRRRGEEQEVGVVRVAEDRRALAEIIEDESRQDEIEPGAANGGFAEMAHVGIERFAAGDGQDHGTQRHERRARRVHKQQRAIIGIESPQNTRRLRNGKEPDHGKDREPHHHDRSEQSADLGGAPALHDEKADQDDERRRDDEGLEGTAFGAQAFDCAEHGDGRRQHPIAVEQRETENGRHPDHGLDASSQAAGAAGQ